MLDLPVSVTQSLNAYQIDGARGGSRPAQRRCHLGLTRFEPATPITATQDDAEGSSVRTVCAQPSCCQRSRRGGDMTACASPSPWPAAEASAGLMRAACRRLPFIRVGALCCQELWERN